MADTEIERPVKTPVIERQEDTSNATSINPQTKRSDDASSANSLNFLDERLVRGENHTVVF